MTAREIPDDLPDDLPGDLLLFLSSTSGSHSVQLRRAGASRAAAEVVGSTQLTRQETRQDNLDDVVGELLDAVSGRLTTVVVDAGPGNLATTRSCVAYANALAYSAQLGLGSVDSLELMMRRAVIDAGSVPVVVMRQAGPHGWYSLRHDSSDHSAYRLLSSVDVAAAIEDVPTVVVGSESDVVAWRRSGVERDDFAVVVPTAVDVAEVWIASGRVPDLRMVEAINETSECFA